MWQSYSNFNVVVLISEPSTSSADDKRRLITKTVTEEDEDTRTFFKTLMMRSIVPIFILFLFFVYGYTFDDDDTNRVRENVLETIMWPSKENIPNIIQQALRNAHRLNSSCYWPDINYHDQSRAIWSPFEHISRLTTMVQALTVNGSSVLNDTNLENSVHCALNVWLVNDWQCPNWWFNEISIPLQITGQLLMLADRSTSFEIEKIKEISYRAAWWLQRPTDTGANLINMLQVQVYRSLATNNLTGVQQGFDRMWQDIQVMKLSEEGIQSDWTYHFHGLQLLSGSYGIVWLNGIFSFMSISKDTRYEVDKEKLLILAKFLTQGDAWMIIGHVWDWNTVGRSISRPVYDSGAGFQSSSIRSLAKNITNIDMRTKLNDFADRLDGRTNATLLIGNRHFYTSDYQSHRRANWSSTIKMQSIRTEATECVNSENIKDEHGGQGVLNIYKNDQLNYHLIFPILDWQGINGITVEHDIPLEPCESSGFKQIKLPFVGGVSDGQYGLTMMDTASHHLTAKRSWHFYDQVIFALMTNLTLNTTNTPWTMLASRILPQGFLTVGFYNGTNITLIDGVYSFLHTENQSSRIQWIHIGESNIGYLLQETLHSYASIGIDLRNKSGNFDTIGVYNMTVSSRTSSIWIDHGHGPFNLDLAYLVFPDVTLTSFPDLITQYANEKIFSCQSSHSHFHGIFWPSLRRASFVLWENVSTTFSCHSPLFQINLQLHDAGAYLFNENETDFTFTASHPMRSQGMMTVTIDRQGYGDGCMTFFSSKKTNNTNVTLILPTSLELLGASVQVTCKKLPSVKIPYKKGN